MKSLYRISKMVLRALREQILAGGSPFPHPYLIYGPSPSELAVFNFNAHRQEYINEISRTMNQLKRRIDDHRTEERYAKN